MGRRRWRDLSLPKMRKVGIGWCGRPPGKTQSEQTLAGSYSWKMKFGSTVARPFAEWDDEKKLIKTSCESAFLSEKIPFSNMVLT